MKQEQEIFEGEFQAFRITVGRGADEPRQPMDEAWLKRQYLTAARKAGLSKRTIRHLEENLDRDAVFECPECEARMFAWAIAQPACPDCGHQPMRAGTVIAR